jgi:hypothetical protein
METKKCPYCSEEIKSEAIKCRFCGEFLANENSAVQRTGNWICMNCKEENENNFDACWKCGTGIEGTLGKEPDIDVHEVKNEAGEQYPPEIAKIVLSVLIFACIGFGFGYYMFGNISGTYYSLKDIFFRSEINGLITTSMRNEIIFSTLIGGLLGRKIGILLKKTKNI